MADIIDPSNEEVGNPQRVLDEFTASATADSTEVRPEGKKVEIPERFKGKSLEEVVESYVNLERIHGRTANDLGVQRQLTDQLLGLKRERDIQANGGQLRSEQKPTEIKAADLLEKPTETLEQYLDQRSRLTPDPTAARIAHLEASLAEQNFQRSHPDWSEQTSDPLFSKWARETPFRSQLAQQAAQGNFAAADAILTEFKKYKPLLTKTVEGDKGLEAARKVTFERSRSGGADTTTQSQGKIWRRADLIALQIRDPDKYYDESFQAELMKAHAEKRVR